MAAVYSAAYAALHCNSYADRAGLDLLRKRSLLTR
jgi:hypothetical protein